MDSDDRRHRRHRFDAGLHVVDVHVFDAMHEAGGVIGTESVADPCAEAFYRCLDGEHFRMRLAAGCRIAGFTVDGTFIGSADHAAYRRQRGPADPASVTLLTLRQFVAIGPAERMLDIDKALRQGPFPRAVSTRPNISHRVHKPVRGAKLVAAVRL
jgi:hypothetical protein